MNKENSSKKPIAILIGIVVVALGVGFLLSQNGPTEVAVDGEGQVAGEVVTTGLAAVDEVDVLILESFPVQVRAVARGNYADGCTEAGPITQQFDTETNTFMVEFLTQRPADALCTQALVPFEEIIPLDVLGFPAGQYAVDVNGVQAQFELLVDNEPVFDLDKGVN